MADITHGTWIRDGTSVDAVYQNGVKAYGRNLLINTGFNNLPQYWTSRAGTVSGTFNGNNVIYYDATKLTDGFTEVFQQPIYDPALTNNRILPSHWYILSFYAKGVGQMNSYVDGAKWVYMASGGSHNKEG